jgi:hypothetical protein
MELIHKEVLEALRDEFGDDKVQQVDDLGGETTLKMIHGEKVPGVPEWMYEVVDKFQELIVSHPRVKITMH